MKRRRSDRVEEPDDSRTSGPDLTEDRIYEHPTEGLQVAPARPSPWRTGRIVGGRYKVMRLLGKGGMGQVFEAYDMFLRCPVAIKVPSHSVVGDAESLQRFREEVALAHAVTHPNVIRTFDLGEAEGLPYLSMEHLTGQTLEERMAREPRIPLDEVREICRRVCAGMQAAHQAGVVHRDLKPSNIMLVGSPRRVVVMDFGIAAQVKLEGDPEPADAPVIGTPVCMAPEQWRGAPADPRSDIYALGVVLFRMLAGDYPFAATTRASIKVAHLRQPPPQVRKLRGEVDPRLAALVERCLAKEPGQRPQSMLAVAEALRPRPLLLIVAATLASSLVLGLLLYGMAALLLGAARTAMLREIRPAVQRLAALTAREIAPADLAAVKHPSQIKSEPYRRVQRVLLRVKQQNPEVKFIYTLRHLAGERWEFVVDAEPFDQDKDGDGKISQEEEGSPPGRPFDSSPFPAINQTRTSGQAQADPNFSTDYWGFVLSGYAPIDGRQIIGIDVANTQLDQFKRVLFVVFALLWLAGSALASRLWAVRLVGAQD